MARKIVSDYAVFQNLEGTRDIVFYYQGGGADSVTGVNAAEADYIVDLLRNEKPISYDHTLKRLSTWSPEPVGEAEVGPDLDSWLNAHPSIAASIVWENSGGAHVWSSWSAAWKAELRQAFEVSRRRGSISVADVPPNQVTLADDQQVNTVLSSADAWAYSLDKNAQSS